MVRSVSAAALNRIVYMAALIWSDCGDLGRQREHEVRETRSAGRAIPAGSCPGTWRNAGCDRNCRPRGSPRRTGSPRHGRTVRRSGTVDGAHRAALNASEMTIMSLPIRLAMAAEGHLQSYQHGWNQSARRHDFDVQPVERACRAPDEAVRALV